LKTKPFLTPFLVLLGMAAAITAAFFLGRLLPGAGPEQVSASGNPPFSPLNLPPQTVNGITVQVESYYADANRILLAVRIDGEQENYFIDDISLKETNGGQIYTSYQVGPLSDRDPSLLAMDFVTANPLTGNRLEAQFAFKVFKSAGDEAPLASFQFHIDIPVSPELIFNPKQSVSANGVEILLDRVVITPAFTQAYLCYDPPTDADWGVSADTTLQVNSQAGSLHTYSLLFDDQLADGSKGGDPDWTPPVKQGRCIKIGFQVGDAHPQSLTLTIPALEQSFPEVVPEEDLALAYEKLKAKGIDLEWHHLDHGAYGEYKKIPQGMTEQEAFRQFVQALGYVYPGEWVFKVPLHP
jgi:hypothetical protein